MKILTKHVFVFNTPLGRSVQRAHQFKRLLTCVVNHSVVRLFCSIKSLQNEPVWSFTQCRHSLAQLLPPTRYYDWSIWNSIRWPIFWMNMLFWKSIDLSCDLVVVVLMRAIWVWVRLCVTTLILFTSCYLYTQFQKHFIVMVLFCQIIMQHKTNGVRKKSRDATYDQKGKSKIIKGYFKEIKKWIIIF